MFCPDKLTESLLEKYISQVTIVSILKISIDLEKDVSDEVIKIDKKNLEDGLNKVHTSKNGTVLWAYAIENETVGWQATDKDGKVLPTTVYSYPDNDVYLVESTDGGTPKPKPQPGYTYVCAPRGDGGYVCWPFCPGTPSGGHAP